MGFTMGMFVVQDLDVIFSNILDIYEFTAKLLSSVEEQMEMAQDSELPLVGTCFEDLAEVHSRLTHCGCHVPGVFRGGGGGTFVH